MNTNIINQNILLRFALLSICLFGLTACDSGSSNSGPPVNAAGKWQGSGAYDQGTIINNFQLDLSQDEKTLTGTYSVTRTARATMNGTVSGNVGGKKITITMTPHG